MQKENLLKLSAVALMSVVLMAPQIAKSDAHGSESKFTDDMFGEVRISTRMSDSIDLSDSTNGSDKVVTYNNPELDGFTSYGFAIGKKFDENAFYSVGIERVGSAKVKLDGFTNSGGTSYTTTTLPFDMTHVIAEIGVINPINNTFDVMFFGGLGYSMIKTDKYTVQTTSNLGRGDDTSGTTFRIGLGAGYRLSEKVRLVGTAQYTDYGEAFWMNTDTPQGNTAEIKATELGVRLVFDF
jgi:opacity protein-like surface antigen